jgi:hypothetical protein
MGRGRIGGRSRRLRNKDQLGRLQKLSLNAIPVLTALLLLKSLLGSWDAIPFLMGLFLLKTMLEIK